MKTYQLENEKLSVTIVPETGGKSISIYGKEKQFELLAQQRRESTGASFAECAAYGFDDAFPSIDAGSVTVGGRIIDYPDHGEIWSAAMQVKSWEEGKEVQLYYESPQLHYVYEKKITLRESSAVYTYRITNHGESTFPCIWAFHCLVRYEEDMRIVYPQNTTTFINVLDSPVLGNVQAKYQVKQTREGLFASGTDYRFDRVPEIHSFSMEKYYVGDAINCGRIGYDYPSQDVECRILYDPQKLPYLGFFVTAGGFLGDYNCALEPCDGYYDSIETALKHQRCPMLEPGMSREFDIEICLR